MVQRHLEESLELHKTIKFYKQRQREEEWRLKRQMVAYLNTASEPAEKKKKQEEEQLIKMQQRLFYAMQYSLNGVPMYKIAISDPPLDVKAYRKTLSYQSSSTLILIKAIKTKPAKRVKNHCH